MPSPRANRLPILQVHGAICLLIATSLFPATAAPPVGSRVVEAFEGQLAFVIEPGLNSDAGCTVASKPGQADDRALRLSWPSQHGTHVACNYQEPQVVVTDAPGKYKISVLINTEQVSTGTHHMAVRLLDQNNEVHQLVALKLIG